ncbi:MAG TPA: hypothetical protein VH208_04550 [Myxococcaceae bacterium]|nr:hypothetical protein [Myxococcaceae bacterium]
MSVAAPHAVGEVVRPSGERERRTVRSMADDLRRSDVNLDPHLLEAVAASPKRTSALRAKDFRGEGTAFDHILRIAQAGKLRDGTPSGPLAADLFGLVGHARRAGDVARCYARTSHSIFSLFHPGELARVVGALAVDGSVTLAGGETVQWNPASSRVSGNHTDYLWASLNQLVRFRELPPNAQLPALSGRSTQVDYASQGQMANLYTRLFGTPHVNVQGAPHLNEIVARTGPLLAEYGAHGGSVAKISPQNVPLGIEAGELEPQPHSRICNGGCTLGYVVMPLDEAQKYRLQPISYQASQASYAVDGFDAGSAPAARSAPAAGPAPAARPVGTALTEQEQRRVTGAIRQRNFNNNNAIWSFGPYSFHPGVPLNEVPENLLGTALAEALASERSPGRMSRFEGLFQLSLDLEDERLNTAYALHFVHSDRPHGDGAAFFDRDGHWLGTSNRGTWSSPR